MDTCSAIIQEGPRKGSSCQFPPTENGYCGRHQRNKTYDDGLKEGKRWCRYFFRGCNTVLSASDKYISCQTCRTRVAGSKVTCGHDKCKNKAAEGEKYCRLHERDKYHDEEKELGIRYCDIARGCFTILKTDKKKCEECLESARKSDMQRYNKRKEMNNALKAANSAKRVCTFCSIEFEAFETVHGHISSKCKECNEKQKKEDLKRQDRYRNYKNENYNNLARYFKEYINSAIKRNYTINIDYHTFCDLVLKKCYYCNYLKEGEVNGIDRLNNTIGYTKSNCVPFCSICNRMKHFYHPQFFIEKCRIFAGILTPTPEFYEEWDTYYSRSCNKNRKHYSKEAEKRGLPFHITQDQWDTLTRSPCYLCNYKSTKGIGLDRVDNSIREYTFENVKPCCGSCNSMKNELDLDVFLQKARDVADNFHGKQMDIPKFMNPLKSSKIDKNGLREHWKAEGLYYAILSNNTDKFEEHFEGCLNDMNIVDFCETIRNKGREAAIPELKKLIQRLKKRRQRLHPNTTSSPGISAL
jgi:hypothetical protein